MYSTLARTQRNKKLHRLLCQTDKKNLSTRIRTRDRKNIIIMLDNINYNLTLYQLSYREYLSVDYESSK